MNDQEFIVWTLAYTAAINTRDQDPRAIADIALGDFRDSCQQDEEDNSYGTTT